MVAFMHTGTRLTAGYRYTTLGDATLGHSQTSLCGIPTERIHKKSFRGVEAWAMWGFRILKNVFSPNLRECYRTIGPQP